MLRIPRFLARPWALLLLTLVYLVASQVLLALLLHHKPEESAAAGAPVNAGRFNLLILGQFLSATLVVIWLVFTGRVLQRRPLAEIGLRSKGVAGELAIGFFLGAAVVSIVFGLLSLRGYYQVHGLSPPPTSWALGMRQGPFGRLSAGLLFFFFGSIFEEVAVRGLIFRLLEEWLGSWLALLLSALLFGLAHALNPGATWLSSLAIALEAGCLLAAAFMVTRSLWLPIGLHWAWNFFEGPILGAAASGLVLPSVLESSIAGSSLWVGGRFGPEAGFPAVLVSGALTIALLKIAARRHNLRAPPWRKTVPTAQGSPIAEVGGSSARVP